jgi:hypothetical protein
MEFVTGEDLKKLIRKMGQIGAGRPGSMRAPHAPQNRWVSGFSE